MTYKGFNYLGKPYVLKDGELYRLPFTSHNRYFGIKKCKRKDKFFILGNGVRKSFCQVVSMAVEDVECKLL